MCNLCNIVIMLWVHFTISSGNCYTFFYVFKSAKFIKSVPATQIGVVVETACPIISHKD